MWRPGLRCLTQYNRWSIFQFITALARNCTSGLKGRARASIRWIQAIGVVCCSTRAVFGGRGTARTCSTRRTTEGVTRMTRTRTICANVSAATINLAATLGFLNKPVDLLYDLLAENCQGADRESRAILPVADFWLTHRSRPNTGPNATLGAATTPLSPRYRTILI